MPLSPSYFTHLNIEISHQTYALVIDSISIASPVNYK